MKNKPEDTKLRKLHDRIKDYLQQGDASQSSALLPEEIRQLLRELQNHQLELEGTLRDQDEYLREIFEAADNVAFVTTDLAGQKARVLDFSPGAEKMFGYSAKKIIGKPVALLHLSGADKDFPRMQQALKEGQKGYTGETMLVRSSGEQFPALFTLHGLHDNSGVLIGTVGVSIDITAHKQTEQALRESEQKYRSMMESMVDPVYICSSDYRIEYLNPAMIKRHGQDLTGEICYATLHRLEDKCEWCVLKDTIAGETFEETFVSPFDNRTYRARNMPITSRDGSISKMTILRDITDYLSAVSDKTEAENRLIQAQKMESVGMLAGGIAHDFNNILSSIIGFTELALDDVARGSIIEDNLQEVYTAGKRAKDLVKQILSFARQTDAEAGTVKVSKILEEALPFVRSSVPTTIEIVKDINSDSFIWGNPIQLHQIFMNLCTNAAHAMEDKGGILGIELNDVIMETRSGIDKLGIKKGNYIEIKVADTGQGIAPDIMGRIFEPYFTTKGPGEGTGMGLAVVHGIIESYGGTIEVDSSLTQGTTFTIYLPITSRGEDFNSYEMEGAPGGSERVLFVDDEESTVKMGIRILQRLGYSVTSSTSSLEALELFRAKPNEFDIVITDMTMPNMTGDTLAEKVMAIRPDIPVVLCTGYSKKISEKKAAEIGINEFIYKPVVTSDLAKAIRRALDG